MGVIKRNNSKNWYIQFTLEGKKYIKSSGTTNKRQAELVEKQWRDELFRTNVLGEQESITIGDAIELYISTIRTKSAKNNAKYNKTFLEEHLDFSRLLETFGTRDVQKLIATRLRTNNRNSTINKTLTLIRQFVGNAKQQGYKTQPMEVKSLPPDKNKLRYLSIEEEQLLLKELQPNCKQHLAAQQDNYDLVVMLLDTGARHGEIATLKWTDIDLENRTIRLFRSKVRNESILFITNRLHTVLTRRYKNRLNRYIFNAKDGGHRKLSPIAINKAMKRAKLNDVSLHTIRHTAASRWVQNGLTILEVSQLLGHADISTTMIYAHLEQTDVSRKAVDIMNKLNKQPDLRAVSN